MRLTDYIQEAISSGKYRIHEPDSNDTVEDFVNWFNSLGIDGYRYGNVIGDSEPPVQPGELVYFVGPCSRMKDTHWVALYNNLYDFGTEWTQEVCMWLNGSKKSARLHTQDTDVVDISKEKAIEIMKEMISNPKKRIRI